MTPAAETPRPGGGAEPAATLHVNAPVELNATRDSMNGTPTEPLGSAVGLRRETAATFSVNVRAPTLPNESVARSVNVNAPGWDAVLFRNQLLAGAPDSSSSPPSSV